MRSLYIFLCVAFCGNVSAQGTFNNTGNFRLHTDANIAFYGNFSNSGTFTDGGTSARFVGTSNQTISGSSVTSFNHLYVNNTAGVTLNQDAGVNSVLELTAGPLTLNSRLFTISSGAPTAVVRNSGYVVSEQTNNSGRLRWNIGTTTGTHEFPFGAADGTYIPFAANLTAGNIGNLTLATYPTAVDNTPYPTTPNAVTTMVDSSAMDNSLNTVDRFWQIDKDGPSGTATLTFTATPAEMGSIQYDIRARRWNTATQEWDAPLPGQSATATSATVPGVTDFSPWTMAGSVTPLPIELLSFTAQANDQRTVDLGWVTATEINNDYFTVERSQDLIHYETVTIQDGAGNSNQILAYTDVDLQPYDGTSYYRLKQTDFDGSFSYSAPVSVNLEHALAFDLAVFPNPGTAQHLYATVTGIQGKNLSWELENLSGQRLWNMSQPTQGVTTWQQKLPLGDLAAGMYVLKASDGFSQKAVRILIE